jgi:glycosyltransferase involved in cell wall biosynthesis
LRSLKPLGAIGSQKVIMDSVDLEVFPELDGVGRRAPMRALLVTPLSPPVEGHDVHAIYKRLRMFVQALSEVSDTIVMLHFIVPDAPEWNMDPVRLDEQQSQYWGAKVTVKLVAERKTSQHWWEYLSAVFSILDRPRFYKFVGEEQVAAISAALAGTDLVFAHRLVALAPFFRIKRGIPPLFFDLDDVEHRLKIRTSLASGSAVKQFYNLLQVPAIYLAERRAAKIAACTFVCSELDRNYLARLGITRVRPVPNALPMPAAVPRVKTEPRIIFLGTYEYPPNVIAAERLICQIWPMIRGRNPQARLAIVGRRPDLIPSFALKPEGVDFTGVVPELDAIYEGARLVCCPITVGGGTRVKLVEAAGYAKPIVSTGIGAEGLSLINGREILIRDTDQEIAEACLELLDNEELCARLGSAARQKAMSLYDVANVRVKIAEHFRAGSTRNS